MEFLEALPGRLLHEWGDADVVNLGGRRGRIHS